MRVHNDGYAGRLIEALQARAFTVDSDIVFGAGQFAPESPAGKNLLAHELVHVVQQSGHAYAARQVTQSSKADDAATCVVSAQGTKGLSLLSTQTLQRQPVKPAPPMTRAEEIRLSVTSPGGITGTLIPPMISLYNFIINQPTLKEEHRAALQAIIFLIKLFPGAKVRIEAQGHADSTGDDIKVNQPLSENRALSVQKVLQSAAPVTVSHCGELCPVATNDTVAGRSRNRRVDINFFPGKKPDDIDWPSLCSFAPVLCLCLKDPARCRKRDGDGDGPDWPCTSLLGALICGLVVCIAASAILRNPMLCLPGLPSLPELLCLLFPSLCKDKPKQPEKEKKRKACPVPGSLRIVSKVDSTTLEGGVTKTIDTNQPFISYPFDMEVVFQQESPDKSPYCDCNCGEYRQYVSGFFERPDKHGGPVKRQQHRLAYGRLLDPMVPQEDGPDPYGHRYEDTARSKPKPNRDSGTDPQGVHDKYIPDREIGCAYEGKDNPGFAYSPLAEEIHLHLKFQAGTIDACNGNSKVGEWKEWEIRADRVPQPPRTPRQPPIICAGLPPNAKVGDTVSLSVHFEGDPEDCYGKIDVSILELSSTELKVWTHNSSLLNIAPEDEDCPEMWIHSNQVWTFLGSPPCEFVA